MPTTLLRAPHGSPDLPTALQNCSYRGGLGKLQPLPECGSSVNPISTRKGADYARHIYCLPHCTGFETLTAALTTLRLPLKTTLFHFFNCVIVCFVECRHIQITMNSNYTSYYEEIDLNRVSG